MTTDELQMLTNIYNELQIIEFTIVLFYMISWGKKLMVKIRKGMGLND